jgi:hypothetical protein
MNRQSSAQERIQAAPGKPERGNREGNRRAKGAALGQDGHACMARAATSRNSFAVAPLAA